MVFVKKMLKDFYNKNMKYIDKLMFNLFIILKDNYKIFIFWKIFYIFIY